MMERFRHVIFHCLYRQLCFFGNFAIAHMAHTAHFKNLSGLLRQLAVSFAHFRLNIGGHYTIGFECFKRSDIHVQFPTGIVLQLRINILMYFLQLQIIQTFVFDNG